MITVLMGGNSAEREVSLNSGETVFQALVNQNIDCFKFDWHKNNLSELWDKQFDKAFIILHGPGGEDGFIQKQLEDRNITYTGSDSITSQNGMNKAKAKSLWEKHGLTVAPSVIAERNHKLKPIDFTLPWAVKPTLEGSSIGISKVEKISQLDSALNLTWQYGKQALIEKWINGNEYTIAILDGQALPTIKIITNEDFYSYDSKYHTSNAQRLCPCGLSDSKESTLKNIALKAFNTIGGKGWGRVDFIIDHQHNPYLLEINTVPGMTKRSLMPMAALAAGISFDELVIKIVNSC